MVLQVSSVDVRTSNDGGGRGLFPKGSEKGGEPQKGAPKKRRGRITGGEKNQRLDVKKAPRWWRKKKLGGKGQTTRKFPK